MSAVQDALCSTVRFLNQPAVKESIKKVAGSVTFALGIYEIYDIYQILKGREITTESDSPQWQQVANKIIIVCAKISLILSAATSPLGVFIISTLMGCFFSTIRLERFFGPNTTFAVNPWHPRHIVSIAAVLLALPAVVQSLYKGVHYLTSETKLTDTKVRLMTLFNILTSRPALHWGNRLCRCLS